MRPSEEHRLRCPQSSWTSTTHSMESAKNEWDKREKSSLCFFPRLVEDPVGPIQLRLLRVEARHKVTPVVILSGALLVLRLHRSLVILLLFRNLPVRLFTSLYFSIKPISESCLDLFRRCPPLLFLSCVPPLLLLLGISISISPFSICNVTICNGW